MDRNRATVVCNILLYGCIICLFIFYFYRMYSFCDFPPEYRDAAVIKVVDDFSKGINPYAVDYLSTDEAPRVVLDSSFLNVFPAALIVKMTSVSPIIALYLLNFLYIVISMFLIYRCSMLLVSNRSLSLIAAILEFLCMRRGGLLCLRPDTLAGALIILEIFIVLTCLGHNEKNVEGVSENKDKCLNLMIILLAFITVIIFFLKPHYVMIAFSIFLFAIHEKRGFLFCFCGFVTLFCFIMACSFLFPTHISVWGVRLWEMFSGVGSGKSETIYMLNKWVRLMKMFLPIFLGVFFGTGLYVYYMVKRKEIVVSWKVKFLCINILINSIVLCYVGRHPGADLWYFFFMLMPSIILLGINFVGKLLEGIKVDFVRIGIGCYLFPLFCFICLFQTLSSIAPRRTSMELWAEGKGKAYEILSKYESTEMLLSSHLANYSIERGIYNFNYGDTCYLPVKRVKGIVLEKAFPFTDDYSNKYCNYANDIVENINNCSYSIITTTADEVNLTWGGVRDEFTNALLQNYRMIDTFPIHNETQVIFTTFWVPQEDY